MDVVDHSLHRHELPHGRLRNFKSEGFFEGHRQFHQMEGIRAQLVECRLAPDLVRGQFLKLGWNADKPHLVGYYGGIWFGKKLDEFNPIAFGCQALSSGPCAPPTAAAFAGLVAYLEKALGAAYDDDGDLTGTDDDLFGFCRWALRFGDELLQPLIVLYGYNVGYTNNILVPPYRSYPVNATTLTKGSGGADPFNPPYNSQIPNLHRELVASGWVTPELEYPSYFALWRALSSR